MLAFLITPKLDVTDGRQSFPLGYVTFRATVEFLKAACGTS